MPSFSGFLRGSEMASSQYDRNAVIGLDNDNTEKIQRRQSKRDFFRSLLQLKRSGPNSSKRSSGQFGTSNSLQMPSPKSADTPASSDPNKPLPAPPLSTSPELEPVTATASRPVKNLQRIISPIAIDDLHKLFSGAPQFFARSEGHHTGAPHPSVAFHWDLEVGIRDLTDHIQIHDAAWGSMTAWSHITRDVQKDPDAVKEHHEKKKAHFLPRCRERPNMLSMQGIERGTMGYAAALEIGVADALRDSDGNLPNGDSESLSQRREKFLNGKSIRHIPEVTLLEHLIDVSTTYHEDPLKHRRPTVQLYTELFTQILFPPSRVTDPDDPYSLQVQIEALIQVLATKDVWVDLSLVEWRIRLGQILWGPPIDSESDDVFVGNNNSVQEQATDRYWLLLQILLSCELLLRLDAVSMNIDHGLEEAKPSEISRFEKLATLQVRWSHILARQWLENILIVMPAPEVAEKKATTTGWLATLTGTAAAVANGVIDNNLSNVRFQGRHQERQLNGLHHFAKKLNWPNVDALASKIASNGIQLLDSARTTPIGTPLSNYRTNSYFSTPRPGIRRGISRSQTISALTQPAGWLSNSYISGLILPGEGLGHFLISTLLEHDSAAVSKLGQEANLYGGFVYSNRSFWSISCVLGRVLAAGKGASECMGWISSQVTPRGVGEAWVNIDVEQLSENGTGSGKERKPRIWHKSAIEHDGNIIGGADTSSVLPGDFILPSEESSLSQALAIKLESLDLFAATESVHSTPIKETPTPLSDASDAPKIQTYTAMMRYSVDAEGEDTKDINLELRYDVHFVTTYPCVSSHHTDLIKSPTSPSFHSPQHSPTGSSRDFTGHPLHKAFTFTKIPISTLLFSPQKQSFESLLSPPQSPTAIAHSSTHTTNSTIPKVLVIDCIDATTLAFPMRPSPSPHLGSTRHKFGSDMEMLARALCAERGWNALISRRGRGCLACSIREAGALGWRVILRCA